MDPRLTTADQPTVVVVDDDAAVLAALGFALEAEGYRVRTFRTAASAFAAQGMEVADCLVIDQNLPDETGVDLLRRLRARGDRAPAIMVTTAPSRRLRAAAEALSAPVVEKPLLSDHLFSCIRDVAPVRA